MTDPEVVDLVKAVRESGYLDARLLPDGSIAAIGDLLYTRAVFLGCDRFGYARRFCFEDRGLALLRYLELQSEDDVPVGAIAQR